MRRLWPDMFKLPVSSRCTLQTLEAKVPHLKPSRTLFVTSASLTAGLWKLNYPCIYFSLSVGPPSHSGTPPSLVHGLQNKATSALELGHVLPSCQDTSVLVPTLLTKKQVLFPTQDPLRGSQVDRLRCEPCPRISVLPWGRGGEHNSTQQGRRATPTGW